MLEGMRLLGIRVHMGCGSHCLGAAMKMVSYGQPLDEHWGFDAPIFGAGPLRPTQLADSRSVAAAAPQLPQRPQVATDR